MSEDVVKATPSTLTTVVAVLLLVGPVELQAQQAGKIATIGVLYASAGPSPIHDAFEQFLQGLGWVRDQNIRIEVRYSAGRAEAFPSLAAELVSLRVDVLVAWSPAGALAAKRSTSQIPVVFLAAADPVGSGLVSSLARPGGNVTGISLDATLETYGKGLELLKEAVPSLTRVARLAPAEPLPTRGRQAVYAAATALKLELDDIELKAPPELEAAVRKAKSQGAQALYVVPSGLTFAFRKQLAELALANRLPSLHPFSENVVAGGLLSYAPSLIDIARRGAVYVDKILKGAKPVDLPVEQPTKFEFVINLKTASALGLTIPASLLLRADQIIQ
ncbi:MAG: ABC transporter substrate-binding protein [Betaproteobacteria bacterium]|nr:ABC transporter substrate-binding protein [Betaproteobacteria bacterium]